MMKSVAQVCFLTAMTTKAQDLVPLSEPMNADELTCNVWQVCNSNKDATPENPPTLPCLDGSDVTVPVFIEGNFAPVPMDTLGIQNLKTACPFYDADEPLCCNSDTAAIMGKFEY